MALSVDRVAELEARLAQARRLVAQAAVVLGTVSVSLVDDTVDPAAAHTGDGGGVTGDGMTCERSDKDPAGPARGEDDPARDDGDGEAGRQPGGAGSGHGSE